MTRRATLVAEITKAEKADRVPADGRGASAGRSSQVWQVENVGRRLQPVHEAPSLLASARRTGKAEALPAVISETRTLAVVDGADRIVNSNTRDARGWRAPLT